MFRTWPTVMTAVARLPNWPASGRVEPMTAPVSQPAVTESWWQKVGRFFAPGRLRYAAFAAVLVAVAGIGFAVWRNSQKPPVNLVAQGGPAAGEEARTVSGT